MELILFECRLKAALFYHNTKGNNTENRIIFHFVQFARAAKYFSRTFCFKYTVRAVRAVLYKGFVLSKGS